MSATHGSIRDGLTADELRDAIVARCDAAVDPQARGDLSLVVDRGRILDCLRWLRDDAKLRFDTLLDITVIDYLDYPGWRDARFGVAYVLKSSAFRHRVRLKVLVEEDDAELPSAHGLWKNADWLEREAWDQYGVVFAGHPNPKRLLNHQDFVGHPLRKDYPVQKRQHLSVNDPMIDELTARLRGRGFEIVEEPAPATTAGDRGGAR